MFIAIPQCLAHPSRSIKGVKPGWIGERISTTDWNEGIGEIMYGSTWAETSLMLTKIQIPGLYVVPDKGVVVCFDNLEARIVKETSNKLVVEVHNPSDFDANVTIVNELSSEFTNRLKNNYLLQNKTIFITAGNSLEVTFEK